MTGIVTGQLTGDIATGHVTGLRVISLSHRNEEIAMKARGAGILLRHDLLDPATETSMTQNRTYVITIDQNKL